MADLSFNTCIHHHPKNPEHTVTISNNLFLQQAFYVEYSDLCSKVLCSKTGNANAKIWRATILFPETQKLGLKPLQCLFDAVFSLSPSHVYWSSHVLSFLLEARNHCIFKICLKGLEIYTESRLRLHVYHPAESMYVMYEALLRKVNTVADCRKKRLKSGTFVPKWSALQRRRDLGANNRRPLEQVEKCGEGDGIARGGFREGPLFLLLLLFDNLFVVCLISVTTFPTPLLPLQREANHCPVLWTWAHFTASKSVSRRCNVG